MKKLIVIPLVAVGMMAMAGCSKSPVKETAKVDAINLANLDTTVAPGTDFYEYACGGWIKSNPLKPEYSRFGTFDQLRENNQEQLRTLINELGTTSQEAGSVAQKIGMLYEMGMDSVKLNKDGMAKLPLTITVSKQGTYQTDFTTTQPNMEGNSKSTFTFNATIKNRTAEQQLYALTAEVERGWNVVFKPNYKQATSAQVEPNATQNITIDVNPPANVAAGTYKIPVHASTGSTSADLELEVVITGSYEMELTTPRGLLSSDITAGDTKRIDLVVKNNGSGELKDVTFSASKPVDWEVSFDPAKVVKLGAGQSTNVVAIVKASKKALPGDYVTKMEAKTPEVNATADFRISVKTPMVWGWVGVFIIVVVLGGVYYLFRKYGRR